MNHKILPTYFISHGGGPWPWIASDQPDYRQLEEFLQNIPSQLGSTPKAVLVISGHWEENEFTVMSNPRPQMVYDYYGFPKNTYQIKYGASGEPEVALQIHDLLQKAGLHSRFDAKRGFDHGSFVPLYIMYPNANIPVLQLSIRNDYDPRAHFEVGRSLAPLRKKGVLIVGSGFSFHNLRLMATLEQAQLPSQEFDHWLQNTLIHKTGEVRYNELMNWSKAPSARIAHPQEDHLIPLMVACGAAESDKAHLVHHENFMGYISTSSFRFG